MEVSFVKTIKRLQEIFYLFFKRTAQIYQRFRFKICRVNVSTDPSMKNISSRLEMFFYTKNDTAGVSFKILPLENFQCSATLFHQLMNIECRN